MQRWIAALAPKTAFTADDRAFAPSMTTSSPSVASSPRATRSASSDLTTVAFSVEPSHSPTGTFVPSAVMARATTARCSARCSPSTISTLMSNGARSRASRSARADLVAAMNRRDTAERLVAVA